MEAIYLCKKSPVFNGIYRHPMKWINNMSAEVVGRDLVVYKNTPGGQKIHLASYGPGEWFRTKKVAVAWVMCRKEQMIAMEERMIERLKNAEIIIHNAVES